MTYPSDADRDCCPERALTWGLYGSPRQWATIYCARCRHVYRRDVEAHDARAQRDEIEAEKLNQSDGKNP